MTAFLVDQQLPKVLANYLTEHGHDARHIKDYSGGTTMADPHLALLADAEGRFVVTKDEDFRISHLLGKPPARLLHLTCGNTSTRDLLAILDQHLPEFEVAIAIYTYLEINRLGVIIHDPR